MREKVREKTEEEAEKRVKIYITLAHYLLLDETRCGEARPGRARLGLAWQGRAGLGLAW